MPLSDCFGSNVYLSVNVCRLVSLTAPSACLLSFWRHPSDAAGLYPAVRGPIRTQPVREGGDDLMEGWR